MFKRFWWVFPVSLLLGPLAGLLAAGLLAQMIPKKYESNVMLQIRSDHSLEIEGAVDDRWNSEAVDSAAFFPTEFEALWSRETLHGVIEKLDLSDHWGVRESEARERLEEVITVRNVPGTRLIEIRVRERDPRDAVRIADALAERYRERRNKISKARDAKMVESLQSAVRDQEEIVEKHRDELASQQRSKLRSLESQATRESHSSFAEARADFESARTRLEQLKLERITRDLNQRLAEDVVIHRRAVEPESPVFPNLVLWLVLGGIGGFGIGILAPFALIPLIDARC